VHICWRRHLPSCAGSANSSGRRLREPSVGGGAEAAGVDKTPGRATSAGRRGAPPNMQLACVVTAGPLRCEYTSLKHSLDVHGVALVVLCRASIDYHCSQTWSNGQMDT
jgi:hypothetical protein